MEKRVLTAEDLFELKSVSDPRLSPDGQTCVYVETSIEKEDDTYYSHLKFIRLNNPEGKPLQWTFGKTKNNSPRWSPDGTQLAFVSNRTGKNQIYVLQAAGGEAKQLTFLKSGAGNPVWSPDGSKIAFTTALDDKTTIKDKEEKEKKQEKPVALEVTKMKYKSDSEGFWRGHYKHIAVVEAETGEITQLTEGEHDHQLYCWSPDGKYLAIGLDESEDKDSSFVYDVYLLNTETRELKKVTKSTGYFGGVSWSPDGANLAMFGQEREYENATLSKLWIYNLASEQYSCLTEGLDVIVGDYMTSDFQYGTVPPGVLWAKDNESFYFLATDRGNTAVYYGNLNGEIYPALLDQQHCFGLTIDGHDKAIIAISSPTETGDLYELTITEGKLNRLTNTNEGFLENVLLSEPEEVDFESADGGKVHGWVMKPSAFEEGKKYPFILEIHGGPHMMYGNTFVHEFQMLAAKGYVVMYVNPRGGHGYGQQFVDAVRGDYGGGDYQDLMAAVDYAVENYDFIDKERLGVTGGSYGGFMTNWIVGHTNRFKAAVTQRSISNWISFYGVSDIGYYFTEWQIKADLNDFETLWKHSPLAYASNVETPLLILHSEKDYRCPIEQAEQMFIALKRQGKTTKFVRFPDENHELSRSGRPALRLSRLNQIAGWFDEYLQ